MCFDNKVKPTALFDAKIDKNLPKPVTIYNVDVYGTNVDAQTRCAHYRSALDIIAVKFKCCGHWFPCFECHAEHAPHQLQIWTRGEGDTRAILCGRCGNQLSIREYVECAAICPQCDGKFNPRCAYHYDLYFENPVAEVAA